MQRLSSLDWLRGIVMVLMVVDHASMAFNGGRLASDSAGSYVAGTALPVVQFLTRWVTHLCAPTFLFLAGTALALSTQRRIARGDDPRSIDRHMLTRGVIIALLDPTLISLVNQRWTFQVLFAIGVSMVLMVPLRRLSTPLLLVAGLGWLAGGELLTGLVWDPWASRASPAAALTVAMYDSADLRIIYPVVPWLAMMAVGWAFGRYLAEQRAREDGGVVPVAWLTRSGVAALLVFVAVRAANGYGNMFLPRFDDSLVQWLHVSKYPPALAFSALELGVMSLLLAGLMAVEQRVRPRPNGVLLVFGQTALFFYLVHRVVLDVPATWLGLRGFGGLPETGAVSLVLMLALYPLCRWYRGYKRAHPDSIARFI